MNSPILEEINDRANKILYFVNFFKEEFPPYDLVDDIDKFVEQLFNNKKISEGWRVYYRSITGKVNQIIHDCKSFIRISVGEFETESDFYDWYNKILTEKTNKTEKGEK
jgi:hypothetical protein